MTFSRKRTPNQGLSEEVYDTQEPGSAARQSGLGQGPRSIARPLINDGVIKYIKLDCLNMANFASYASSLPAPGANQISYYTLNKYQYSNYAENYKEYILDPLEDALSDIVQKEGSELESSLNSLSDIMNILTFDLEALKQSQSPSSNLNIASNDPTRVEARTKYIIRKYSFHNTDLLNDYSYKEELITQNNNLIDLLLEGVNETKDSENSKHYNLSHFDNIEALGFGDQISALARFYGHRNPTGVGNVGAGIKSGVPDPTTNVVNGVEEPSPDVITAFNFNGNIDHSNDEKSSVSYSHIRKIADTHPEIFDTFKEKISNNSKLVTDSFKNDFGLFGLNIPNHMSEKYITGLIEEICSTIEDIGLNQGEVSGVKYREFSTAYIISQMGENVSDLFSYFLVCSIGYLLSEGNEAFLENLLSQTSDSDNSINGIKTSKDTIGTVLERIYNDRTNKFVNFMKSFLYDASNKEEIISNSLKWIIENFNGFKIIDDDNEETDHSRSSPDDCLSDVLFRRCVQGSAGMANGYGMPGFSTNDSAGDELDKCASNGFYYKDFEIKKSETLEQNEKVFKKIFKERGENYGYTFFRNVAESKLFTVNISYGGYARGYNYMTPEDVDDLTDLRNFIINEFGESEFRKHLPETSFETIAKYFGSQLGINIEFNDDDSKSLNTANTNCTVGSMDLKCTSFFKHYIHSFSNPANSLDFSYNKLASLAIRYEMDFIKENFDESDFKGGGTENINLNNLGSSSIKRAFINFIILSKIFRNVIYLGLGLKKSDEPLEDKFKIAYDKDLVEGFIDGFRGNINKYVESPGSVLTRAGITEDYYGGDDNKYREISKFLPNYLFAYKRGKMFRDMFLGKSRDLRARAVSNLEVLSRIGNIYKNMSFPRVQTEVISRAYPAKVSITNILHPKNPDAFDDLIGVQTNVQLLSYPAMKRKLLRPGIQSFYLPASKDISLEQIKAAKRFFKINEMGFKKTKNMKGQSGGKIIIHAGMPAQMIERINNIDVLNKQGATTIVDGSDSKIRIYVLRNNLIKNQYEIYKKSFIFDVLTYYYNNVQVPDNIVDRDILEKFSITDNDSQFLDRHVLSRVGFEGEEPARLNNLKQKSYNMTELKEYLSLEDDHLSKNHIADFYLKQYTKIMTGLDFEEDIFQLTDDSDVTIFKGPDRLPFSGITDFEQLFGLPMDELIQGKNLSSKELDSINRNLFRVSSDAQRSIFFAPFKYLYRVLRTKSFDRVFSFLISENPENFSTIDTESLSNDQVELTNSIKQLASDNYKVLDMSDASTSTPNNSLNQYFIKIEKF